MAAMRVALGERKCQILSFVSACVWWCRHAVAPLLGLFLAADCTRWLPGNQYTTNQRDGRRASLSDSGDTDWFGTGVWLVQVGFFSIANQRVTWWCKYRQHFCGGKCKFLLFSISQAKTRICANIWDQKFKNLWNWPQVEPGCLHSGSHKIQWEWVLYLHKRRLWTREYDGSVPTSRWNEFCKGKSSAFSQESSTVQSKFSPWILFWIIHCVFQHWQDIFCHFLSDLQKYWTKWLPAHSTGPTYQPQANIPHCKVKQIGPSEGTALHTEAVGHRVQIWNCSEIWCENCPWGEGKWRLQQSKWVHFHTTRKAQCNVWIHSTLDPLCFEWWRQIAKRRHRSLHKHQACLPFQWVPGQVLFTVFVTPFRNLLECPVPWSICLVQDHPGFNNNFDSTFVFFLATLHYCCGGNSCRLWKTKVSSVVYFFLSHKIISFHKKFWRWILYAAELYETAQMWKLVFVVFGICQKTGNWRLWAAWKGRRRNNLHGWGPCLLLWLWFPCVLRVSDTI